MPVATLHSNSAAFALCAVNCLPPCGGLSAIALNYSKRSRDETPDAAIGPRRVHFSFCAFRSGLEFVNRGTPDFLVRCRALGGLENGITSWKDSIHGRHHSGIEGETRSIGQGGSSRFDSPGSSHR